GAADAEIAALSNAIRTARKQLLALSEGDLNPVQRGLFEAHATLLDDPEIQAESEALIREGDDALQAWKAVIAHRAAAIASLDDAHLAERAGDIRDIGMRVRKVLLGIDD